MALIYMPQGTAFPGELITEDTQIQWDGLLMGRGSYFGYKSLVGWDDLPGIDSTDSPRPHSHGDFPGSMWGQGRIITLDTQIYGPIEGFPELRREFLRRFQIEQEEQPLIIQQHGEMMMCFARVVGRSWPIDRRYFGGYPIASVQWKASDPRKYSVNEESTTLEIPVSVGGLDYTTGGGLDYTTGGGLDYGTVQTGVGAIVNSGLSDTPVRIEFVGPLTAPYYVNTEDGSWTLGFTLDLAAGETLIADARLGTVTLGGVDRYYALALQSDLPEDCLAPPGTTPVQFAPSSSSDTGHVDIYWRHAQM